jgi:hypothetical protein
MKGVIQSDGQSLQSESFSPREERAGRVSAENPNCRLDPEEQQKDKEKADSKSQNGHNRQGAKNAKLPG